MPRRTAPVRIGVISDTHGLVRPEALRALRGSDLIIHAGDVGHADVLDALRAVARVVAVRGNNDRGSWARTLAATVTLDISGARFLVLHDVKDLVSGRVNERVDVVIAGHSHRPSITRRDGVLFLNPGSAGPRRFTLPVSVARVSVRKGLVRARLLALSIPDAAAAPRRADGR